MKRYYFWADRPPQSQELPAEPEVQVVWIDAGDAREYRSTPDGWVEGQELYGTASLSTTLTMGWDVPPWTTDPARAGESVAEVPPKPSLIWCPLRRWYMLPVWSSDENAWVPQQVPEADRAAFEASRDRADEQLAKRRNRHRPEEEDGWPERLPRIDPMNEFPARIAETLDGLRDGDLVIARDRIMAPVEQVPIAPGQSLSLYVAKTLYDNDVPTAEIRYSKGGRIELFKGAHALAEARIRMSEILSSPKHAAYARIALLFARATRFLKRGRKKP